jgi:BASS family bile acid:Na+ symporter
MRRADSIGVVVTHYFAVAVLAVSALALWAPTTFMFALPHISTLLGIVMFGMGTTLSTDDFKRVLGRPRDVLIGVGAQFGVMPALAFAIAAGLGLPDELAVGLILVGACPGGTASNVIAFLAKGDVALSVTMTSVSTLLAPVLTPALTLWLAGRWMDVPTFALLTSILKIVVLPVVLGVLAHRFFKESVAKTTWLLPLVSVAAILTIVGAIVGKNSAALRSVLGVVLVAVALHNLLGLLLGYSAGRLLRAGAAERRTITIEVGMQNSGLAVALAVAHFSPLAAIPGVIFSVWHNLTGSALASVWARRRLE